MIYLLYLDIVRDTSYINYRPLKKTHDEAMDTSEVQPSVGTSKVCVLCQDIVFGEFKCLSCNKNVHVKCG